MPDLSFTNLLAVPPLPPLVAPTPTSEASDHSFDDHLQKASGGDELSRTADTRKTSNSARASNATENPPPRETDRLDSRNPSDSPNSEDSQTQERTVTNETGPQPVKDVSQPETKDEDKSVDEAQAAEIAAAAAIVSQVVAETAVVVATIVEKSDTAATTAETPANDQTGKSAALAEAFATTAELAASATPVAPPVAASTVKKTETKEQGITVKPSKHVESSPEVTAADHAAEVAVNNAGLVVASGDAPIAETTDSEEKRTSRKTKGDQGVEIAEVTSDSGTTLTPEQTVAAIQAGAQRSADDQGTPADEGSRGKPEGTEKFVEARSTTEGKNAPPATANAPARLGTAATAQQGSGHTAGSSNISDVDRVRFVQRVARAFQAADENGGEIRLRLSPPSLGSLKLEIQVQDGGLSAKLQAETESARSLLLENLPLLRERLAEQNIRITQFDVELMDRSPGGLPDASPGNSDTSEQRGGNGRRPGTRQTDAETTVSSGPRRSTHRDGGQLNIVI